MKIMYSESEVFNIDMLSYENLLYCRGFMLIFSLFALLDLQSAYLLFVSILIHGFLDFIHSFLLFD